MRQKHASGKPSIVLSPYSKLLLKVSCGYGMQTPGEFEVVLIIFLLESSVAGIVITYRDITKRKQAETALHEEGKDSFKSRMRGTVKAQDIQP